MARPSTQQQSEPVVVHNITQLMDNLTKAISHLSFSSKPRTHLFDLPQEIQDIIFDHAYPVVSGFKTITRWWWEHRERTKRKEQGSSYTIRPFPPPKVSQFLVSKRFFFAAAKAFISRQVFSERISRESRVFGSGSHNVVIPFVTKARFYLFCLRYIAKEVALAPNLKSLELVIREIDFDSVEPKYPCEEELDDKDIKTVASLGNIECLTGIEELHLTHEACDYAKTVEGIRLYDLNVRKLEKHIRSIVPKPRQRREVMNSWGIAAIHPPPEDSLDGNTLTGVNAQQHHDFQRSGHSGMKLNELPSTVEDMEALLKKDGENFMRLVADLKAQESNGCR